VGFGWFECRKSLQNQKALTLPTNRRSQLHDHVQGNKEWPDVYDGRAIIHPSYRDEQAGVSLEDNEKRYKTAQEAGDTSRMVTWA
jgi:nitronate monooxygenase